MTGSRIAVLTGPSGLGSERAARLLERAVAESGLGRAKLQVLAGTAAIRLARARAMSGGLVVALGSETAADAAQPHGQHAAGARQGAGAAAGGRACWSPSTRRRSWASATRSPAAVSIGGSSPTCRSRCRCGGLPPDATRPGGARAAARSAPRWPPAGGSRWPPTTGMSDPEPWAVASGAKQSPDPAQTGTQPCLSDRAAGAWE